MVKAESDSFLTDKQNTRTKPCVDVIIEYDGQQRERGGVICHSLCCFLLLSIHIVVYVIFY